MKSISNRDESNFLCTSSHHTGSAPDVSWRAVISANQNLHRAILTRLNVLSEVFVLDAKEKEDTISITFWLYNLVLIFQYNFKHTWLCVGGKKHTNDQYYNIYHYCSKINE